MGFQEEMKLCAEQYVLVSVPSWGEHPALSLASQKLRDLLLRVNWTLSLHSAGAHKNESWLQSLSWDSGYMKYHDLVCVHQSPEACANC